LALWKRKVKGSWEKKLAKAGMAMILRQFPEPKSSEFCGLIVPLRRFQPHPPKRREP
jgi:hypothetical protein